MKVFDLIKGKVEYDNYGGNYFWIKDPEIGNVMLAEMRGWSHIKNMFKDAEGNIDEEGADEYQDEISRWVADAINEKIARDFK